MVLLRERHVQIAEIEVGLLAEERKRRGLIRCGRLIEAAIAQTPVLVGVPLQRALVGAGVYALHVLGGVAHRAACLELGARIKQRSGWVTDWG